MASHEREAALLPGELFRDHDGFSEDSSRNHNNNKKNHCAIVVSPKGLLSYESISVSCGSACSSWSDLSSPFVSELESTSESTESDDEEFISELTRRMAESMLQDDDEEIQDQDNSLTNCLPENSEGNELSMNWSEYKSDDSVCSYYNCSEFMNISQSPTSDSPNVKTTTNKGMYPDDHSTDEQLRPVQVYQMKNQLQVRKQSGYGCRTRGENKVVNDQTEHQNMQNRGGGGVGGRGKAWKYGHGKKNNAPPLLPTPQTGSGMRAVILKGPERSGCTGTGVFLPSGAYNPPERKRKPGCSTVLIPARVLQTLQQHFNTVGAMSPSNPKSAASPHLPWQNDVLARINGLLSQQKEHADFQTRPASSAAAEETNHHPEVQLPQEWTY